MNISEVSKEYGLSADTLRYYERIGLIPLVPRKKSGLRDYDEEACQWVKFIKCMRGAGLTIETLIEYVKLFQEGKATIKARKKCAKGIISEKNINSGTGAYSSSGGQRFLPNKIKRTCLRRQCRCSICYAKYYRG